MRLDQLQRQMEGINRGMRLLAYSMRKSQRTFERAFYSRGDLHIDEVCRSIARGEPGHTTSDPVVRLIVASDFAAVLDGKWRR